MTRIPRHWHIRHTSARAFADNSSTSRTERALLEAATMFRKLHTLPFALTLCANALVLIATPREAHACSPPSCAPARLAPAAGSTAPANAPALPYLAPTGQGAENATTFRLLNPGGAETPTTSAPDTWWTGGQLLQANSALAAGAYRIVYKETCAAGGLAEEGSRAFNLAASATLPTSAGKLRADNFKVGDENVFTSSGSCYTTVEALTFDLLLTPESTSFAPVTGYEVKVDGKAYKRVYYGAAKANGNELVVATLHAACGTRQAGDDNGLTLGTHDVEVAAHVAGAASDPPPVTVKINVSCTDPRAITDDTTTPVKHDYDPEDPANGGTTKTPAGSDAGTNAASGDAAQDGCACVAAGTPLRSSNTLQTFGAVAGVVALLERRRRRSARLGGR